MRFPATVNVFVLFVLSLVLLTGCASKFPTPSNAPFLSHDDAAGSKLFTQTLHAHGGQHLHALNDVSVGITGKWKRLIRCIQPLVTDFTYRVDSQERLFPKEGVYAAHYSGPAGNKSVFRQPGEIAVHYNDEPSLEPDVLSSTALTADAFHLFLLGPLALEKWRDQFQRIADKSLNGKLYQRLYLKRSPGFGYASADEVVLWVDPESRLTKMIQITLLGHETTKAAHVEVEYLAYKKIGEYTFATEFFERVNAPIAIDAHVWRLTGLQINSGYSISDLRTPGFTGEARFEVGF